MSVEIRYKGSDMLYLECVSSWIIVKESRGK